MPLMIKLNRNVVRVYLCLDNGHFITVIYLLQHFVYLNYEFTRRQYIELIGIDNY